MGGACERVGAGGEGMAELERTHPVKTVRLRGDEDGSVQATTVVATVAA